MVIILSDSFFSHIKDPSHRMTWGRKVVRRLWARYVFVDDYMCMCEWIHINIHMIIRIFIWLYAHVFVYILRDKWLEVGRSEDYGQGVYMLLITISERNFTCNQATIIIPVCIYIHLKGRVTCTTEYGCSPAPSVITDCYIYWAKLIWFWIPFL